MKQNSTKKNIFKNLNDYSHGFCQDASEAEKAAYNAKVEELTKRIEADIEHAPEIIAGEYNAYETKKYRALFAGLGTEVKKDAEWYAIENVTMALTRSEPLK